MPKKPLKQEQSTGPKCSGCYHFERHSQDSSSEEAPESGTCYRYPPTVATFFENEEPIIASVRSEVAADDRACGEFKPLN